MRRLIRVDLPAPVGPTMATLLPAGISIDKSLIKILSGLYPKETCLKEMAPLTWSLVKISLPVSTTSGLSKTA